MKGSIAALGAFALGASAAATQKVKRAITPVTVKGNAFFAGNERFYIRGIDYQPGGSSDLADPIADAAGCTRDIAEFQKLGINTVRVYTVDNSPSADHDACMSALADAGIYLALDVNSPNYSLRRDQPGPSYNSVYLQNIFATIDIFSKYDNTLLFFSGNEVVNDGPSSSAAPYVKAVTRDMRGYIAARNYRKIPVGYSAADINTNRLEMAQYMNCGSDDERSDLFAFNDYSYCGSSYTVSGWDQKVKNFTGYGLPLFLSEYGCNTNPPRTFSEVADLYSSKMTGVYSGGLVYEYSQEPSNYGLVDINGNTVSERPDFTALQTAYKNTPNPTGDGGYNSTGGASACPAYAFPNWAVKDNSLPAMPAAAQQYFQKGAGTGVGLSGSGSQEAGGAGVQSSGTATAGSSSPSSTAKASGSGSSSGTSGASTMASIPSYAGTISFIVSLATLSGALLL